MYRLYDTFMPAEMRSELLESVYDKRVLMDPEVLEKCKEWFATTVTALSCSKEGLPRVELFRGGNYPVTDCEEGSALNSGIHTDGIDAGYSINPNDPVLSRYLTKYLLTVANNQRSGTMFFDSLITRDGSYGLVSERSENLFERAPGGGLIYRDGKLVPFAQPCNGQLVTFDMDTQAHAAAPQYRGDIKVLFSFESRSLDLPEPIKAARGVRSGTVAA